MRFLPAALLLIALWVVIALMLIDIHYETKAVCGDDTACQIREESPQ